MFEEAAVDRDRSSVVESKQMKGVEHSSLSWAGSLEEFFRKKDTACAPAVSVTLALLPGSRIAVEPRKAACTLR